MYLKGEYDSWIAFKKAMYKERIDQLTKLKPITIEYELRNPNSTKKVTIRSYAQMQKLMDEAVAEDVGNITNATSRVEASWVNLLKKKIYNAYLVRQMISDSLYLRNKEFYIFFN